MNEDIEVIKNKNQNMCHSNFQIRKKKAMDKVTQFDTTSSASVSRFVGL